MKVFEQLPLACACSARSRPASREVSISECNVVILLLHKGHIHVLHLTSWLQGLSGALMCVLTSISDPGGARRSISFSHALPA